MNTKFTCAYHPTRNEVDKCENCSAYVCLECKKVFREDRSRGRGSLFDNQFQRAERFSPKTVLCPPCYYKAEEQLQISSNRSNVWFPMVFVTIFIGFFLFILAILFIFIGESRSFTIIFWIFVPIIIFIPVIFFSIFIITTRFSKPRRISYIQKEREVFQQSVGILHSPTDFGNQEPFCSTCGAIIEFNERFCPKCGSSTHKL